MFSGRVQNVGFRATAQECASRHVVSGWVRNEPDGTVLMEIQGARSEIDATLDRLRARMEGKISGTDLTPLEVVQGEKGFRITR